MTSVDELRMQIETILGNAAAAQVQHLRGRIDVRAMAETLIRDMGLSDPLSAFRLRACAETMDAYWASVGEEFDGDTLREEADAVDRYKDWIKPGAEVTQCGRVTDLPIIHGTESDAALDAAQEAEGETVSDDNRFRHCTTPDRVLTSYLAIRFQFGEIRMALVDQ